MKTKNVKYTITGGVKVLEEIYLIPYDARPDEWARQNLPYFNGHMEIQFYKTVQEGGAIRIRDEFGFESFLEDFIERETWGREKRIEDMEFEFDTVATIGCKIRIMGTISVEFRGHDDLDIEITKFIWFALLLDEDEGNDTEEERLILNDEEKICANVEKTLNHRY